MLKSDTRQECVQSSSVLDLCISELAQRPEWCRRVDSQQYDVAGQVLKIQPQPSGSTAAYKFSS